MTKISVVSHIIPDIVHGGYDCSASLTLWFDASTKTAHLTGHSGSLTPLDGPEAPKGAPSWAANGKPGHVAIFSEARIEAIRVAMETLLSNFDPADPCELLESCIGMRLNEVDLAEASYEDWLLENDPETYKELYA